MSIVTNLHTHTFRCGHAKGTETEFIERAISCGIKTMGFSDHMPFKFPNGYESGYRVKTDLAEDYIATLTKLKNEYKEKIDIHIGFEMEYYPDHFEAMLSYAKRLGAEYLILGEHFPSYEDGRFQYTGSPCDDVKALKYYADGCIEGMKTGVFTYLAHPDVFNFTGDDETYVKEMTRVCLAAKQTDTPLEINFLGIRSGRHYPKDLFWKIAGETGCSAVFGFDAHSPASAFDGDSEAKAREILTKYNIKLIDTPKIISIQGENK